MSPELSRDVGRGLKIAGLTFALCVFGGVFWPVWSDSRKEAALRRRTDFDKIAAACERLIQQLGTNAYVSNFGQNKMPAELEMLPVGSVYVWPEQVRIFYGGAYHHWGLDYLKDTNAGNRLTFRSDGRPNSQVWPQ